MRIFPILLFPLLASFSHADVTPSQELAAQATAFASSADQIVNSLLKKGILSVGTLNLESLSAEINQTQWRATKDIFALGSGKDRATAIYLIEERTIVINGPALPLISPEMYPITALHEALAVNGYDDEDYAKTLALYFVSKDPSAEAIGRNIFEAELLQNPKSSSNKHYQDESSDGGVTSVGGGGDSIALEVKLRVIEALIELLHESDLEVRKLELLLKIILKASFESNYDFENQSPANIIRLADGEIRATIPAVHWIMWEKVPGGNIEQDEIVADLLNQFQRISK